VCDNSGFGHHIMNDKCYFALSDPLSLLVSFSDIMSFILLSLSEYVNIIRIRIIIIFFMIDIMF
jgi:hypothetical protein